MQKSREERNAYLRRYRAENRIEFNRKRRLKRKADHSEHTRAYQQTYRDTHKETQKIYNREYCRENQKALIAYRHQYRETHCEERATYDHQYWVFNKEKITEYKRQWRAQNKDKHNAYGRRRRARKASAPVVNFTAQEWREMKAHYSYRCVYCSKKSQRLTQDHITPLSKGGSHTKSNIVPACKSCNSKKGINGPLKPIQPLLL